jgi:hypothetical protein
LPHNLNHVEKVIALVIQAVLWGGAAITCVVVWKRMKQAFAEGLRGNKEAEK